MRNYLLNGFLTLMLFAPDDGNGGGGGGSGGGDGKGGGAGSGGDAGGGNADLAKQIEALKKENAELKAKQGGGGSGGGQDDPDLISRAKAEQDRKSKEKDHTKSLESAVRFTMTAKEWAKTHAAILPKDVEGIFAEADKENYDSAVEKSSAIKSALVQSFFSQQSNLDLLTPSQKISIEEFLKLTKNGKQEKASAIYDSVFEPTFEMLKRLEKAKQLRADGHSNASDADKAYKEKMMKLSRAHYMGEKKNA